MFTFPTSPVLSIRLAGPTVISLLGYDLPVLSALLACVGAILTLAVAPAPARRFHAAQKWALRILLVLIALALVIHDQKTPLIALGWGIGLGFSGYTVIELLGAVAEFSEVPLRLNAASERRPQLQSEI